MEQSHSGEVHDDAVLVAGLDDDIISHRAARLSYIPDTTAVSTLDIVAEREERVGAESYAVHLVEPGSLFLYVNGSGLSVKNCCHCPSSSTSA